MISDPTARADEIASRMREWYEANRENWWHRHMPVLLGGSLNMWRIASDDFILRLVAQVQKVTDEVDNAE